MNTFKKYKNFFGKHIVDDEKFIYLKDLIPLLEKKEPTALKNSDINWMGFYTQDLKNRIEQKVGNRKRFEKCDVNIPGIVVEDPEKREQCLENDKKKYRMIDGTHRMAKLILSNIPTSIQYVITKEEYESFFRDINTGMLLNQDKIELKYTKNVFGFPVAVYRYKNHQKNKKNVIDYLEKNMEERPYPSSTRRTNPKSEFFDNIENSESLKELKSAMEMCYNHFYTQILKCRHFFDFEIIQSWGIEVKENNHEMYDLPLQFHTHFMSPVCGVYYTRYNKNGGGKLLIKNPYKDIPCQLEILLYLDPEIKYTEEIDDMEEGDIVLFCGHMPHAIDRYKDSETRLSVATNSTPVPLLGAAKNNSTHNFRLINI